MATLAELKTRIITETNRDDMGSGETLEDTLTLCITQAIEFYADEQFWFNRISGTTDTTASDSTADLPSGMRSARVVAYSDEPLQAAPLDQIEYRTGTGLPRIWAENEGTLQLWPIPDATYTLSVYGLADLGVPASSNEWTTSGYDLIAARTRLLLYRDYLRDADGAGIAAIAEAEALSKLRRETRRRGWSPRTTDLNVGRRYNINTDR